MKRKILMLTGGRLKNKKKIQTLLRIVLGRTTKKGLQLPGKQSIYQVLCMTVT